MFFDEDKIFKFTSSKDFSKMKMFKVIENHRSIRNDLLFTKHRMLILSTLIDKGAKIRGFGFGISFLGLIMFLSSRSLGRHDESRKTIGIERN